MWWLPASLVQVREAKNSFFRDIDDAIDREKETPPSRSKKKKNKKEKKRKKCACADTQLNITASVFFMRSIRRLHHGYVIVTQIPSNRSSLLLWGVKFRLRYRIRKDRVPTMTAVIGIGLHIHEDPHQNIPMCAKHT